MAPMRAYGAFRDRSGIGTSVTHANFSRASACDLTRAAFVIAFPFNLVSNGSNEPGAPNKHA